MMMSDDGNESVGVTGGGRVTGVVGSVIRGKQVTGIDDM